VTFKPSVAESFPSIRLLLPGDPLFSLLLSIVTSETQGVSFVCGSKESDGGTRIDVCQDFRESEGAEVVVPAAAKEGLDDLPDGKSLNRIPEAEQIARNWLSET
jgi:hypothetical protein